MIETLNGFIETVNFKKSTTLKLYDNVQVEDYPSHWHSTIEIIMPLKNGYTINFNNKIVKLREDDICLICPGCIHAIAAPESGRRIIFQPNISHLRFMSEIDSLMSAIYPYVIITPEEYPQIHEREKELLLSIKKEYLHGNSCSEMNIYCMLLEMLVLIGRNKTHIDISSVDDKLRSQDELAVKLTEICDYINLHCCEDLKLDELAALSGFSKYYFERLFKRFTGMSFYKYVNQKRIAKAQELLVEPRSSVTDVAVSCGYSSISSFIRMFKLHKGCTPTEFKNMYWKGAVALDD
jgi:AraC-like DNA-binding protein